MTTFAFGSFTLDTSSRELREQERIVAADPRHIAVLLYFLENPGRVISREELIEKLWPKSNDGGERLSEAVVALRDALHDRDARIPRYIAAAPPRGYKFVASVSTTKVEYELIHGLRRLSLAAGENIIGRAGDATVQIRTTGVSRHHARLVIGPENATIEDLESKNGTMVNRRRIKGVCELKQHDEVGIGDATLIFQLSTGMQAPAVAETPASSDPLAAADSE